MRLSFELWLDNNPISLEAKSAFEESIICYKVGANKAAFLFSYLGLQLLVKETIQQSTCPEGLNESDWRGILNCLSDEDRWDREVFDCVTRKCPVSIFLIDERVRNQYRSFRDLRNLCAHAKNGGIHSFHIDFLWSFIEEEWSGFVVNGGEARLVRMLEDHFDISKASPEADCSYLIYNLKLSNVDPTVFLNKLMDISTRDTPWFISVLGGDKRTNALWDKLASERDQRIHDALIKFILDNIMYVYDFAARYPNIASEVLHDNAFARKFWTGNIGGIADHEKGFYILVGKAISENVVPQSEMRVFLEVVYKTCCLTMPDELLDILNEKGYRDIIENNLLRESSYCAPSGYSYANKHANDFVTI